MEKFTPPKILRSTPSLEIRSTPSPGKLELELFLQSAVNQVATVRLKSQFIINQKGQYVPLEENKHRILYCRTEFIGVVIRTVRHCAISPTDCDSRYEEQQSF